MSVELVTVEQGCPKTTTLQIALGLGVKHENVIKLVRSYMPDFAEFGKVGFKIQPRLKGQHGGGDVPYFELNEQQATFLMTLMRNSPKVIEFKKTLVKAFFTARALLQTDYFSLVEQRCILAAQFDFEKDTASECGRGLANWKKTREQLQIAIKNVERQMQPQLPNL